MVEVERTRDAFHWNALIGWGVNLGNALEAPKEGQCGVTLREEYFDPLFMGEFGAYSKADMASRARWTEFVRRESEKRKTLPGAVPNFERGIGPVRDELLEEVLAYNCCRSILLRKRRTKKLESAA